MLHHPDDAKWIKSQLAKLPPALRQKAITGYDRVFREVYHATPLPHQKEGEARREANTRLRLYVEAVIERNSNGL